MLSLRPSATIFSRAFSSVRYKSTQAPLLVTPKELQALNSSSDVCILDASWHMPNSPRKAHDEFLTRRIPGARHFSLDKIASSNELGLMHMMPNGRIFAKAMERLGIRPSSHIVIYDSLGIFSAPRALFTFKALGHDNSSVLDGGLPRWEAEGLNIESGTLAKVDKTSYPRSPLNRSVIRSYEQMVANSYAKISDPVAELVLDARARGRYLGTDPEPRAGLPSGHIPNSFSLPFNHFLRTNTVPGSGAPYTTYLAPSELRQKLVDSVGEANAQAIIEGKRNVITTCGSGMTAGVIWLGLKLINEFSSVSLYDESWAGYASRKESKIDNGEV